MLSYCKNCKIELQKRRRDGFYSIQNAITAIAMSPFVACTIFHTAPELVVVGALFGACIVFLTVRVSEGKKTGVPIYGSLRFACITHFI